MLILRRTVGIIDTLGEWLGRVAAVFAPLMLLVTCYIVITRYVFNTGSVAVQELVIYCNALLFTLGAGYTLKHDAHVRVDIFYGHASPRTRAWTNLLGTLLLLLPVTVFILVYCWAYVSSSWAIREQSPDTGGLPYIYLLKTLILVLGGTLIIQGIGEALRSGLRLLEKAPASGQQPEEFVEEENLL